MKKMGKIAAVTALVLAVGATTAFACGGRHGMGSSAVSYRPYSHSYSYCADVNCDGVCDYHGANCKYVDADGDGVCDNYGTGCQNRGRGHHSCR